MREFRELEQRLLEVVEHDPRTRYGLLALRCGIRVTQAFMDWAGDEIAGLAQPAAAGPQRRDGP
jgi:hypothetical protein